MSSTTVAAQTGHSQFCLLSFRDLSPRLDAPAISMAKSRNGLTAVGLSVLGAFLVLLAFTTKSWVVTDGKLEHPKFERIGQYNFIISQTCARASLGSRPYNKGSIRDYHTLRPAGSISPVTRELGFPD